MLNSLINLHDFVALYEKITKQKSFDVIVKLFGNKKRRVKSAWSHVSKNSFHWWDIPQVNERCNLLITGSKEVEHFTYISQKYLNHKNNLKGISLGCGSGNREIKWVQACETLNLVGYDISKERINQAKENAVKNNLDKRLKFELADVYSCDFGVNKYDLIIFEGSLHHFHSLHMLVERVKIGLKQNGILIVNEYVGPLRFQWTDRQMEIINGLLMILPNEYKKKFFNNKIKHRVYRPGRLTMYLSDPSEAVESNLIEECLSKNFKIVEKKIYGGTILQNLFKDIAHNFINEEQKTKDLIQLIFTIEDEMMQRGDISSDFIFFVCKQQNNEEV
ncbi:MAG: class I SAM-dependent methyltransferase [Bacteroidota bacterium]|jgi:ubiquinone/menaquinone biosynthesis C-methylase UbiE